MKEGKNTIRDVQPDDFLIVWQCSQEGYSQANHTIALRRKRAYLFCSFHL